MKRSNLLKVSRHSHILNYIHVNSFKKMRDWFGLHIGRFLKTFLLRARGASRTPAECFWLTSHEGNFTQPPPGPLWIQYEFNHHTRENAPSRFPDSSWKLTLCWSDISFDKRKEKEEMHRLRIDCHHPRQCPRTSELLRINSSPLIWSTLARFVFSCQDDLRA